MITLMFVYLFVKQLNLKFIPKIKVFELITSALKFKASSMH